MTTLCPVFTAADAAALDAAIHARQSVRAFTEKKVDPALLTDVLQPHGKDGIQFAQEVHEAFPQCAILLMSGYTEDAMERNKKLDKPFALLRKPFSKAELSRQLRIQLDSRIETIHRASA